jgi:hypothetical protein
MSKSFEEIEKEFIDGLKASTGKDLPAWLNAIKDAVPGKRDNIITWLKGKNGFIHSHATMLVAMYMNNGKPVYGSEEELVNAQFEGKEALRDLYSHLISFVQRQFASAVVIPKKTYISIAEKKEFAAINIKKTEIRLGLDLGDMPFTEEVQKSKLTGPMPRISHMILLTDKAQLNVALLELLTSSYKRVN